MSKIRYMTNFRLIIACSAVALTIVLQAGLVLASGDVPVQEERSSAWYSEKYCFTGRYSLNGFQLKHTDAKLPFIDKYGQFIYKEWLGKIHSDEELSQERAKEADFLKNRPSPSNWNQYGGWKNGPKFKATGHFRAEKIGRFWWLIDPEGALFWSVGPVRVSTTCGETPIAGHENWFEFLPDNNSPLSHFYDTHDALLRPYYKRWKQEKTFDFSGANLYRKYGPTWRDDFMQLIHQRLRSWGMNTIANGSDPEITRMNQTPYVERIEVVSEPVVSSPGLWRPISDPFDPSFREELQRQLNLHCIDIESPWCIGLFVDNELGWGGPDDVAKYVMAAPGTQCAKVEFLRCLKEKYKDISELNQKWGSSFSNWDSWLANTKVPGEGAKDDLVAFSNLFITTYFKTIREAFDESAPETLYLGCRFAGVAGTDHIARIAASFCDVLSFNIYAKDVNVVTLPVGVDKPVLIGEFHFGALDRGPLHGSQVPVANQQERATSWTAFANSALDHPNIIGIHWHQYGDQATSGRFDGENFQNGLVDACDTPYEETVAASRATGDSLYKTRYRQSVTSDNLMTLGNPQFQPALYSELPDNLFNPDALCYDSMRKILYLSVPNFIRETLGLPNSGAFLVRVYPDGKTENLLEFPLLNGKYVGCMGMDIGPDGNLYVCDMQYFDDPNYNSRVLRVILADGKPTGEIEVVVDGLKVANTVYWDERGMFVTDTILDREEYYGSGAVWLFPKEEALGAGRTERDGSSKSGPIHVAKKDDPRQIIIEPCEDIGRDNNCGADGLTKDNNGIYYFGNYGDGAMWRFVFDENNKPVVEQIHQCGELFRCVDGICYDPLSDRVYISDSCDNSIWSLKPAPWGEPVAFELVWENGDTTGENGLLDLPCECRMVDGRLVIVNQDEGIATSGKNQATDKPYSLSVIDINKK